MHGFLGKLANWIENWPGGSSQRVVVEGFFSYWRPVNRVLHGVLQGLLHGPLLLVIQIVNGDNTINIVSKFAHCTKIDGRVDREEGYPSLQRV